MTTVHQIDLSSVPHGPGRSVDLEAKRRRAWERLLTDDDRRGAMEAFGRTTTGWDLPCLEAGGAYEITLYVLVVTGARLTPEQVAYLLVARWYRNTDPSAVRARLAALVSNGHVRWTRDGRYYATTEGVEYLREIEKLWLARLRVAPEKRPSAAVAAQALRRAAVEAKAATSARAKPPSP